MGKMVLLESPRRVKSALLRLKLSTFKLLHIRKMKVSYRDFQKAPLPMITGFQGTIGPIMLLQENILVGFFIFPGKILH